MNQETDFRTVSREEEIDLAEMFRPIYRRSRLIIGITAASAIMAGVVSMLLSS